MNVNETETIWQGILSILVGEVGTTARLLGIKKITIKKAMREFFLTAFAALMSLCAARIAGVKDYATLFLLCGMVGYGGPNWVLPIIKEALGKVFETMFKIKIGGEKDE